MKKIFNLLKKGGALVLGFNDEEYLEKMSVSKEVFRYYSQEDVMQLIRNAGFSSNSSIQSTKTKKTVTYCAVAVK